MSGEHEVGELRAEPTAEASTRRSRTERRSRAGPSNLSRACFEHAPAHAFGAGHRRSDSKIRSSSDAEPCASAAAATAACAIARGHPSPVSAALACVRRIAASSLRTTPTWAPGFAAELARAAPTWPPGFAAEPARAAPTWPPVSLTEDGERQVPCAMTEPCSPGALTWALMRIQRWLPRATNREPLRRARDVAVRVRAVRVHAVRVRAAWLRAVRLRAVRRPATAPTHRPPPGRTTRRGARTLFARGRCAPAPSLPDLTPALRTGPQSL